VVAPLLKIDYAHIGHCVMVRAKGDQVAKIVGSAFRYGGNVVDVDLIIKPTDNATVIVAERHLLANELPSPAFPVPVEVSLLGVEGGKAKTIAKVLLFELARVAVDRLSAVCASCCGFTSTPRSRNKPLPFAVALVIAASAASVFFCVLDLIGLAANGTSERYVTAFVVAVVLAAMLVKIQVSALLARLLVAWNNLTATTCAVDNLRAGIFYFPGHWHLLDCRFYFKTLYHDT
jgi:hypothetical protein